MRLIVSACGAMIVACNFYIALAYMLVFSGIVNPVQQHNNYRLYFGDVWDGMKHFGAAIDQLGILAWPHASLTALGLSVLALLAAGYLALRDAPPSSS